MASTPEKGNQNEKNPLDQHDAVSNVIKDDDKPSEAVSLVGYVGKSKEPNSIRLYINTDFDTYIDVPKDKILYTRNVSENIIELGGTRIWIPKDLHVKLVRTNVKSIQAKFLKGDIFGGSFKNIDRPSSRLKDEIVLPPDLIPEWPPQSYYPRCSSEGGPCRTFPAVC